MADENVTTQPAEVKTQATGTTTFGIPSLSRPTPMWVTWVFRVVLILTTAFSAWVAVTGLLQPSAKVEILLLAKGIDFTVWGLGRFVGIKREDFADLGS